MSRETKPYKRSFSTSVGTGLSSLLGGSGKQYYILEHKISSKYHKAGESQEIIIDSIELGRDAKCQVRFDHSFTTVSRRHAAIIKDGDNWKLVHLSDTNPTLLNGRKVSKEWYLQNGDEIQLSIGGPKLGFIIPSGKNASVGSIGLTRRLSLFRKQALRPYKTAITLLSCLLLLVILGAGGGMYRMKERFEEKTKETTGQIERLLEANTGLGIKIDSLERQSDSILNRPPPPLPPAEVQTLIDKCKDDVYFLYTDRVYVTDGWRTVDVEMKGGTPYGWMGTGFLLNDGRFVTARHCVQAWRFEKDRSVLHYAAMADSDVKLQIVALIKARNRKGKTFSFKSTDFEMSDKYDLIEQMGVDDNGNPILLKSAVFAKDERVCSTDWAFVHTSSRGSISADFNKSKNLQGGTELHILGFPKGIGVGNMPTEISPTYNNCKVSNDGLDNTGCFIHTRGTDHGNSGGPIFARQDDRLVVIGIVSRGSRQSDEYNYGVPISAIQ